MNKTVCAFRWHFYCCVCCSGGSARGAALLCCSTVFFALPFKLGIVSNLWQLVLLFLVISFPIPHNYDTQNVRMYVGLSLVFCCTRSGLFLHFFSLASFASVDWVFKALAYAPFTHPSTPWPSPPLSCVVVLECILFVWYAESLPTTTTCVCPKPRSCVQICP